MKTALIVCSIALLSFALLFFIYLMLIMPSKKKREEMKKYNGAKLAHRGLHNAERPENSLPAFAAAVEAGYGIELDIRLSKDGELVVFHDDTLERVTGAEGRVDSKTASELAEIKLCGTNYGIPTFREVLELVSGRVPLLVEIKEDAFKYGVTEKAAEVLADYSGEYIVESFNPLAITRFRELVPSVPTGLRCCNSLKEKRYRTPMYFALQCMLLNFRCRPDFIAYNHADWKNAGISLIRFFFSKTPLFCWTLRSTEEEGLAKLHGFSGFIFENYESELKYK